MKKNKGLLAILALLLAILACAGPDIEDAPKIAGTITYEESTPVTQIEAKEAIQIYGRDVLGIDIPNLMAGGASGEINLPVSTQEGVDVAIDLAGTTYLGFWKSGVASLSIGDSEVNGDLIAEVQDGTLGAFAIRVDQAFPSDAPTALGMIITTYPKLAGYEFFETNVEEGFGFTAGQTNDIHLQGWNVSLTGTTISVGVKPGIREANPIVWVVVASGDLATPINQ